jgi:hypothetical protein
MGGPACEVLFDRPATNDALRAVDSFLASHASEIQRTRKGKVWQLWLDGRPIHVAVLDSLPGIELSAGSNSTEDYEILRRLATGLAELLGGVASEPTK